MKLARIAISFWLVAFQFDLLAQSRISSTPIRVVKTLAELDALPPSVDAPIVDVLGLSTANDLPKPMRFVFDRLNTNAVNRFTRATTNGVGRWVHDWDGDARAFGVVGGTTNDTPRLQDAIYYASSNNIPVILPDFDVLIGEPIRLPSNTTMIGSGKRSRLVRAWTYDVPVGFGEAVIKLRNDYVVPQTGWDVDKFPMEYPGTGGPAWPESDIHLERFVVDALDGMNGPGIALRGVERCTIRDVEVRNTRGVWAYMLLGRIINVEGCRAITGSTAVYNDGIHIAGGELITVSGCYAECGDDCFPITYDNVPSRFVSLVGNTCYSVNGHGIRIELTPETNSNFRPTTYYSNIVVSGLAFKAGKDSNRGILVAGGFDGYNSAVPTDTNHVEVVSDIVISGITMEPNGTTNGTGGILVRGAKNVTISDVMMNGNRQEAVDVQYSSHVKIRNVKVPAPSNTSRSSIRVLQSSDVDIDDCTIYVNPSLYGVNVQGSPRTRVRGNRIATTSGSYATRFYGDPFWRDGLLPGDSEFSGNSVTGTGNGVRIQIDTPDRLLLARNIFADTVASEFVTLGIDPPRMVSIGNIGVDDFLANPAYLDAEIGTIANTDKSADLSVSVPSVVLGDFVKASFFNYQSVTGLEAWVPSAGTVSFAFFNETGGDQALGTNHVRIWHWPKTLATAMTNYVGGVVTNTEGFTSDLFTISGAEIGDWLIASYDQNLQGVWLYAWIESSGLGRYRMQNETDSDVTIAAGNVRVMRIPHNNYATLTQNVGTINNTFGFSSSPITGTDAKMGDLLLVSPSVDPGALIFWPQISSDGVCRFRAQNESGANITNLNADVTYYFKIVKPRKSLFEQLFR